MVSSEFLYRPLQIVDTTLRDGDQTPGVAFSVSEKKLIADKLAAIGVSEIEAGTPAAGEEEMTAISEIVDMNLSSRVIGWCRANAYDLDCAHACGLNAVHISLPVSAIHLRALGKTKEWALAQVAEFAAKARRDFEFVSLGLQDASRAEMDFLVQFVNLSEQAQVDRVRLADTVGVWDPIQTYQTMQTICKHAKSLQIGFHAHNDLGMATANSIAAIRAGADSVDVTVNGLGDRAGNAPLDEVVMAARVSLGIDCGIDNRQLVDLAILVENASGRALPLNKPITGQSAFLHESGIHVHAMLKDQKTYEPFDPATVGRGQSEFVLGKHSGKAALRHVLSRQGLTVDNDQEQTLLELIRSSAIHSKNASRYNNMEYRHTLTA